MTSNQIARETARQIHAVDTHEDLEIVYNAYRAQYDRIDSDAAAAWHMHVNRIVVAKGNKRQPYVLGRLVKVGRRCKIEEIRGMHSEWTVGAGAIMRLATDEEISQRRIINL